MNTNKQLPAITEYTEVAKDITPIHADHAVTVRKYIAALRRVDYHVDMQAFLDDIDLYDTAVYRKLQRSEEDCHTTACELEAQLPQSEIANAVKQMITKVNAQIDLVTPENHTDDIDHQQSDSFNPHEPIIDPNVTMSEDDLVKELLNISRRFSNDADICQHLADMVMGFDLTPAMCNQVLDRFDIEPSPAILNIYADAAARYGFNLGGAK